MKKNVELEMVHPCYSVISPEQLEEFCKQNEFVLEPGYPYLDLSEERKKTDS